MLTIWGAFASVIFLPAVAWAVEVIGWRGTVRILAVVVFVAFVLGASAVPSAKEAMASAPVPLRTVFGQTTQSRDARLFTVAVAFGGVAMSTILVYQVPAMTAAGLAPATAATMAGLRGFAQLGGRLPLSGLVARLGADRSMIVAFGSIAIGGALLAIAGSVWVAVVFAAFAGFGIGAFSPLQGMKSAELFDRENLGATMGFYGSVLVLFGSAGPLLAGVLADATGDRRWAAGLAALSACVAAVASLLLHQTSPVDRATQREAHKVV